jgi:hypothetical protein
VLAVILGTLAAGQPLHYWGARAPVLTTEPAGADSAEARIVEVHTAVVAGDLILRFTFDRPVAGLLYLPGGAPVSGRLRATLYLDTDDDLRTGLDFGSHDLRTGADRRLEIGVVSVGEDVEEKRKASAVVVATLHAVTEGSVQEPVWRADDETRPDAVSWRGEWLEVRVPGGPLAAGVRTRLVLAQGGEAVVGRLAP